MAFPRTRHEIHYGERIVRAFADRPLTVDAVLRETVDRAPDRTALVLGERRVSFRELDAAADRIAFNLLNDGLAPGERVAILLDNSLEFMFALFGASRAGLISVPMNTRQRRPEIEFVLNQCGAAALIHAGEYSANLPERTATPALREVFVVGDGPGRPFAALTADGRHADLPKMDEDSPFCLLYTSGTTGKPKGATLTHFCVVHSLLHYQHAFGLRPDDVGVLAVPASHVTGLVAIILAMVRVGGTSVVMPAFKARRFLELAQREKMTYTLLVPAMYNLCLLDPDFSTFDLGQWRVGGFGGAPMPQATIDRLSSALPRLSLANAYGSTETSSPATLLPLGDIATRPTSVGKPLPCADIIVVDEDGVEVPRGESGELLIAGPMVVPGYWDNPDANRTGFVNGYWKSGDIGSIDEDGYVYVFDRKKDMINRAGFKVYCVEVEDVLSRHPSVVESAVVGRPDPVLGEKVHAFIFADGRPVDEASIRSYCAARLSDYKVPDSITVLDEPLPRNANGKIVKTSLRDLLPPRS